MTPPASSKDMADKLRTALEMFDFGESIYRQKLRREDPLASESEIDERVWQWLSERPGAKNGDSPGRLRQLAG